MKASTLIDRARRAFAVTQRANLVVGMIVDEARLASEKTAAKLIGDVFSYTVTIDGKRVTKWHVPSSTVSRWANAAAVARTVGYSLDADDNLVGPDGKPAETVPPVSSFVPGYRVVERVRDLEEGEARDALASALSSAWQNAEKRTTPKRLDARFEAEVAKVLPKKSRKTSAPKTHEEESSDTEVVVTVEPAAVLAAQPNIAAAIEAFRSTQHVSRVKVELAWLDCIRFVREWGVETVAMALDSSAVERFKSAAEPVETVEAQ